MSEANEGRIKAPFTPEQVKALNEWQQCDWVHPFTCGRHHPDKNSLLVATPEGWKCPSCDYTQDCAHDFMAEGAPPKPEIIQMDKPMSRHKDYMGDGVYVAFDGCGFDLTAENGISVQHFIYLEPEVIAALLRYVKRIYDMHDAQDRFRNILNRAGITAKDLKNL